MRACSCTLLVAGDHDRLPADVGGQVVVVVRQLALVGEVDPVALEDVLHLQLEQLGIGERLPATAVAPVLGIHVHRTVDLVPDLFQGVRHRRLTSVGSFALISASPRGQRLRTGRTPRCGRPHVAVTACRRRRKPRAFPCANQGVRMTPCWVWVLGPRRRRDGRCAVAGGARTRADRPAHRRPTPVSASPTGTRSRRTTWPGASAAGATVRGRKLGLTSRARSSCWASTSPRSGCCSTTCSSTTAPSCRSPSWWRRGWRPSWPSCWPPTWSGPGVTTDDALGAIGGVLPALEVVDSRVVDWRSRIADTVADNAGAARVVLGERQRPSRAWTCGCSGCCSRATAPRSTAARARPRSATRPPCLGLAGQHAGGLRRGAAPRRRRAGGGVDPDGPGPPRRPFRRRVRPPGHRQRAVRRVHVTTQPTDPHTMADGAAGRRARPHPDPAVQQAATRSCPPPSATRRRSWSSADRAGRRDQAGHDQQGQAGRAGHPRAGVRPDHRGHAGAVGAADHGGRADPPARRAGARAGGRAADPAGRERRHRARRDRRRVPGDRGGRLPLRRAVPAGRLGRGQRGRRAGGARRPAPQARPSSWTCTCWAACSASPRRRSTPPRAARPWAIRPPRWPGWPARWPRATTGSSPAPSCSPAGSPPRCRCGAGDRITAEFDGLGPVEVRGG